MLKESIAEIDMEDDFSPDKFVDQNTISHEYEAIVTNLKEDLSSCKLEHSKLRLDIESLQKDQSANDTVYRPFINYNHEQNTNAIHVKDTPTNLEKQVTALQMEKDSIYQLWQMALKAIDVLEEELQAVHKEDKSTKMYQEQINNIKETYSGAIKALESKLIATKENFSEQQILLEKSKGTIDQLAKEKNHILEELTVSQRKALENEITHQQTIDSLKENLNQSKSEIEQLKQTKSNLEEKLKNAEKLASTMLFKDHEAKSKISEAVELVESAVEEKEKVLKREAQLIEDKMKLETRFASLSAEYAARLEQELAKAKELYETNIKKYSFEIKELKAELREQSTLLDRSQRECRLVEEELEKIRQSSDIYVQRSSMQVTNLEQCLQERDLRLKASDESRTTLYDDRIRHLENQISQLQEKLSITSDKLRFVHMQSCRDVEDHMREADDRSREILEKCSNFERQLTRALLDKENLASDLHALQASFEKEMQRRSHEKVLLENKVRDLQEKFVSPANILNGSRTVSDTALNRRNTERQA